MAPSVTLGLVSDFNPRSKSHSATTGRTLLLSPPSLSSHPEVLTSVLDSYDRGVTDIQMLDRLSLGLISPPESAYETILLLTDPDGTRTESSRLLGRDVLGKLVRALKPGGILKSQDGTYAMDDVGEERREAILAGLVVWRAGGMARPGYSTTEVVTLGLNKRKNVSLAPTGSSGAGGPAPPHTLIGKRKNGASEPAGLAGVGFVDFDNDFGEFTVTIDDDELIDEDTLLDEEDMARPIVQRKLISCDCSGVIALTAQLLDAARKPVNVDVLAKTAPAVSRKKSKLKTLLGDPQRKPPLTL
ncbi:MAG: electron carrier [Geoglossum simile]|nr:MAG: electron carrier [Geoglossum simile]